MRYTENFTIVLNKHILNKDLDPYEFRVLCYLLKLSDEKGICYPSYSTMAERIGIGKSKAVNAVNRLVELGIIKKEKQNRSDGSLSSNVYIVCEKSDVVTSETNPCLPDKQGGMLCDNIGSVSDSHYKYPYINNHSFINNHLSIDDVLDKAEIYSLSDLTKKHFESALEVMYNSKAILVGGEKIPREKVRERLQNISYEHIAYVERNMPRVIVNGETKTKVRNPVSFIITMLYNALKYTEEEIAEME